MVADPEEMPLTTPVTPSTEATDGAEEVQVPPVEAVENAVVAPIEIVDEPEIVAGMALTVMIFVAAATPHDDVTE